MFFFQIILLNYTYIKFCSKFLNNNCPGILYKLKFIFYFIFFIYINEKTYKKYSVPISIEWVFSKI